MQFFRSKRDGDRHLGFPVPNGDPHKGLDRHSFRSFVASRSCSPTGEPMSDFRASPKNIPHLDSCVSIGISGVVVAPTTSDEFVCFVKGGKRK